MVRLIRLLKRQAPRLGFLFFWLWTCCGPVSAQLINLIRMNSDFYDEWAPCLFQSGELAQYSSNMPERPASVDSLPALPWAYEIDERQFRHHMSKLDGWVWLVASNNACLQKTCPTMPANLPVWVPFFDSLKATGQLHVRYATTSYFRRQALNWRRSLDERGVRDPLLLVSNEAHGFDTERKLRRFMRQLAPGKRFPPSMDYHLLFDPQGNCVLFAADRYDHPLAKKPPKKTKALYPAEIQRQALLLMQQGGQ